MTRNTQTLARFAYCFGLSSSLLSTPAAAQELGPSAPDTIGEPNPAPVVKSPYRADWDARYARARADLVAGRDAEADVEFDALAESAPTPEDASRAQELS